MLKKLTLYIFLLFLLASCESEFTPKPNGYLRIDLPEKAYLIYDSDCPFTFEYPKYAIVTIDPSQNAEPCWINIEFPGLRAKIHCSYKKVHKDVAKYLEDARTLVYKHTVKADAINEKLFENKEKNVYGILYDIKGNAASSIQFYLTDSVNHFLRGALYFNVEPNKDSLAPAVKFIHQDIERLINTFQWK